MASPNPNLSVQDSFSPTATVIAPGQITNAEINAAAAIAFSKLAPLTSGNILVGSAGNVATSVAMSGNATIIASGAVTVTGATGDFTVGGKFIGSGITTSTGAGAVAVTGTLHEITTTGTGDALTLANGTAGQRLSVIYVAEGAGADTAVLTPTTLAGGNTITFNALGDTAELVYSATGGWYMLGGTAILA